MQVMCLKLIHPRTSVYVSSFICETSRAASRIVSAFRPLSCNGTLIMSLTANRYPFHHSGWCFDENAIRVVIYNWGLAGAVQDCRQVSRSRRMTLAYDLAGIPSHSSSTPCREDNESVSHAGEIIAGNNHLPYPLRPPSPPPLPAVNISAWPITHLQHPDQVITYTHEAISEVLLEVAAAKSATALKRETKERANG